MPKERKPPIILPPTSPPSDSSKSAAFIFVHGLGDEAEGVENMARQFQSAGKLPHMSWVLPNALENHDLATTAWYMPTRLSPYPPSRPELEDDEDEEGIMATVAYLTTLIDDLISQGVLENRIILGGFSQGHAMALLTGLVSKYTGKLGGLVGLSGYLPLSDRIPVLRGESGLPKEHEDDVEVFLARGTGDRLVPKRYHRMCYETLYSLGVKEERVTLKEYEGMGHVMGGAELRDLCAWLESVVPGQTREDEGERKVDSCSQAKVG
ncbi:alpha/beta-hydrolase [Clathrospora elynae]|uniref:Acyl-protein thioesterase 1 n=1 Tax=Clathrospora elynae TaxID=706981 RepID=A0A6A5T1V6_9PLEO|nr:alpha/beta-hydrolase [Clathrospora elynae]